MVDRPPVLVLCAHGTRDPAGAAVVRRIAHRVNRLRPELEVIRGYVDIQSPHITDLAAALSGSGRRYVVVPLLLSAGHHVLVDVPSALHRPGAVGAAALGPAPELADLLVARLLEAGAQDGDAVVLAAAGSTRAEAAVDAQVAVRLLRERWSGPVEVGYGASAKPTVAQSVARLKAIHPRVAIASYLVGPGHFHSMLATCGADVVSAPLGAHESLVRLVLERYDSVAGSASGSIAGVGAEPVSGPETLAGSA